MKKNTQISELLTSEMSRREFLVFAGGSVLLVLGIYNILQGIKGLTVKNDRNYNGGPYGGYGGK